jgi:DNA-binding Lrp family transcriptional regulator
MQPDKIDRTLLGELQRDARMTNSALAQRVGLSESACLRRVRNLEAAGVIEGYGALRAVARDATDLERMHSKAFTKLPGVARVQTSLALRQVVRADNLPLG